MKDFCDKVMVSFGGIAGRYGFSISELSETEIVLRKDNFALAIYCDRDGVGVNYLWHKESGGAVQYPLGHLLHLLKKEWVPSTKKDQIESELEAYAFTLEQSALDILSGDTTWMNKISITPFPVSLPANKK